MQTNWRPTTTLELMQHRATMLIAIRRFFEHQKVLEVDTPILSQSGVTDIHLQSLTTHCQLPEFAKERTLYLQTSPEYAMKRLLCADFGDLFQITKAFRNEELGRIHNPEFTMLEWYRMGYDHHQLMDDMNLFLQQVCQTQTATRQSYQACFLEHLSIDPLSISISDLKNCAAQQGFSDIADNESNADTLLQLLFSFVIEPKLGLEKPIFIYHFPASQAALARIDETDKRVARRFEVYWKGIELANGFHELSDPTEQRQRFERDNQLRKQNGLQPIALDENFLSALEHGLPDCSGVALGIDRLFMLHHDLPSLSHTMCFPTSNA